MVPAVCCPATRFAFLAVLLPALAWASPSDDELFFKSVSDVNDGDLHFLTQEPAKPVHHHQNHLFLDDHSLSTGWVRLEQCHQHLDAVPTMQIVYSKDRIRKLAVLRSENIGKSWVHEHTVQMERVEHNALICISAESLALNADGKGGYSLSNGPYMRRFLDGYYPMRVSMDVTLETDRLRFVDVSPAPQPGFRFARDGAHLGYDALFEGRLSTILRFAEIR